MGGSMGSESLVWVSNLFVCISNTLKVNDSDHFECARSYWFIISNKWCYKPFWAKHHEMTIPTVQYVLYHLSSIHEHGHRPGRRLSRKPPEPQKWSGYYPDVLLFPVPGVLSPSLRWLMAAPATPPTTAPSTVAIALPLPAPTELPAIPPTAAPAPEPWGFCSLNEHWSGVFNHASGQNPMKRNTKRSSY